METIANELLLDIFSLLPYGDLKHRIPLVSRRFYHLLQRTSPASSTDIDKILFRDAPARSPHAADDTKALPVWDPKSKHGINPSGITLNPVFHNIAYSYTTTLESVSIYYYPPPLNAVNRFPDHPVRNENACSPSVRKAYYIHHFGGPEPELPIDGTGSGGAVTVFDVMDKVVEMSKECEMLDAVISGYSWWAFDIGTKLKGGVLYLNDNHEYGDAHARGL